MLSVSHHLLALLTVIPCSGSLERELRILQGQRWVDKVTFILQLAPCKAFIPPKWPVSQSHSEISTAHSSVMM